MPTQRKIETVQELTEKLSRAQLVIVADYRGEGRGMSVADMTELRRKLREHGGEVVVAKNTLLKIAANHTGRGALDPLLAGPTAVTFAYDDVSKVAKALLDYLKSGNKSFTVRGALLGQALLPADALEQVTKLPSREQALAQVVGGIAAPVSGVVGVLNAAISNVLYVLQARIDQLQPQSSS
ncbi:MAG: 50S ribosomal protein L10 [Chloroflexus aggregans]|uniref:Large ribosomal subunit protein uL10 n=1 Tax=Chloroflexus aggregans TaxID=152260 RepID=A0A2J6WRP3_9CHLR|nr:MAG: 50S ribosomal protein L10 [Chloroflexus aggregans]